MTRRPYTTRCRFFSDSDAELDIVWYPCTEEAKDLGLDAAIYPLDFSQQPWVPLYPGEVWERYNRPYNARKPIPGSGVGGVCGTPADFAEGNRYEDERGHVRYRTDGLPWCCPVPLRAGGGAHGGGGGVAVLVTPGSTCPTATVVGDGDSLTFFVTGTEVLWYRFAGASGLGTVHATVTTDPGSGLVLRERRLGTDCDHFTYIEGLGGDGCFQLEAPPGEEAWFLVASVGGADVFGTITFGLGFCP